MKRYMNHILMALCVLLAVVSCNDAILNDGARDTGYLSISLGVDDEILSKSVVAPSEEMAFRIEVYKGNELVAEVDDHRTWTMEAPLTLPVGTYKVKAIYGNNIPNFDAPYYVGETEVAITTDDITNAQITCTLANVKVTVEFDESITENFMAYSVYVHDGTGVGLKFSLDSGNLDAEGYLPATGKLQWDLAMTNNDGGSYTTHGIYEGVKARQHYNLKFALSEEVDGAGYAAVRLTIDDSVVEQEFDIDLDFSESVLPSFSPNSDFELTNEMSVIVGDESKKELTFSAEEGIKSLILALDSDQMTKSSALVWYELVEASSETISYLASRGIKTSSVAYGATSAVIDITDYVKALPTGDYNVNITLYDTKGHVANCPMDFAVISAVDADMVSVTPWAKFAIAKGKYFSASAPEGTTFMYRKSTESSWTSVSASDITFNTSAKTFEAEIGGLDASSAYVIKAVSAADTETREVEFRTESAEQLYNMSFDDWYKDGKVYYPFAEGANPNVWDSANAATASFGGSSTTPETSHVISGKAVRMESKYVVIAFAAGNLYTGNFGKINGLGAILDWGTAFSSRPVALRGWYDYTPATINRTKDPYSGKKGTTDKCQLMVLLTDWSDQFTINTTESIFVDLENDPNIIAFGKYESDVTTGGYREFVLPIEYRDVNRTPKYVVVVACSSYLGDYFTGGEGSTLYVDEFSFEYDITNLTDAEKAKVNYR